MKAPKRIKDGFSLLLKPLRTADRFLIVFLIILGISSLFFISLFQTQGETVQIFQNNELKYQFSLNDEKKLLIENQGSFIQICIQDRKVWVNDSSCLAKICKKMGKISKTSQTIICVPNKVFIQIIGKNNKKYIDAITQ